MLDDLTLYLFVNVIPGKSRWGQAALTAATFVAGWGALAPNGFRAELR
jgi:hypothetical protein